LINTPLDPDIRESSSTSCFPPLSLISIATHLREHIPEVRVNIVDGGICSTDYILTVLEAMCPDLIGVSTYTASYSSALNIAKAAKKHNSIVVFGNDHASHVASAILTNQRETVDFIVHGDYGEIPMELLIRHLRGEIPVKQVPGLVWRGQRGKINANPIREQNLDEIPIADRHLLPKPRSMGLAHMRESKLQGLTPYVSNFREKYPASSDFTPTTINIARGCKHGSQKYRYGIPSSKNCIYCDICDLRLRHVSPHRAWSEVRYLVDNFGIDFLHEVADSFTSFPAFIESLVRHKPSDLNVKWFVYARAKELANPRIIDLLKQLGVIRVNVGMDSGDDTMLRALHKGHGVDINKRAAQLLARNKIQLQCSFVLGAPGETTQSLQHTVNFLNYLLDLGNVVAIDPSPLLPLPGAPAWRMLTDPEYRSIQARRFGFRIKADIDKFVKKYVNQDCLSTGELAEEWVRQFCNVDYNTILRYMDRLLAITGSARVVRGGFGIAHDSTIGNGWTFPSLEK